MILLTVDPGKGTGIAAFKNGILWNCGLFKCVSTRQYTKDLFQLLDNVQPDQAVVEIPRVYPFECQIGDQNDLIKLAVLAGICIAAISPFCQVQEIYPQEWKGQRPKKVDNEYTKSLLHEPIETDLFEALKVVESKKHNVLDAIGIGFWKLGRRK